MKKKSVQMRLIEAERKAPLEAILPDLFARLRTVDAVAADLGIHRVTLYDWLDDLGAKVETTRQTSVRFDVEQPVS